MITDKLRTCVAKWGLVPIVVTMLALGGCQPKDGDRGPAGPQGPQGQQGDPGPQGPQGDPGKDADQGSTWWDTPNTGTGPTFDPRAVPSQVIDPNAQQAISVQTTVYAAYNCDNPLTEFTKAEIQAQNCSTTVSGGSGAGGEFVEGDYMVVDVQVKDRAGNPIGGNATGGSAGAAGVSTLTLYINGPRTNVNEYRAAAPLMRGNWLARGLASVQNVNLLSSNSTGRSYDAGTMTWTYITAAVPAATTNEAILAGGGGGLIPGSYAVNIRAAGLGADPDGITRAREFKLTDVQILDPTFQPHTVDRSKCAACHLGADSGTFYFHHSDNNREWDRDGGVIRTCKNCHNMGGGQNYNVCALNGTENDMIARATDLRSGNCPPGYTQVSRARVHVLQVHRLHMGQDRRGAQVNVDGSGTGWKPRNTANKRGLQNPINIGGTKLFGSEDTYVGGWQPALAGRAFGEGIQRTKAAVIGFPSDVRNCEKCHADDAYQLKPSRLACGACHDNVNFEFSGARESFQPSYYRCDDGSTGIATAADGRPYCLSGATYAGEMAHPGGMMNDAVFSGNGQTEQQTCLTCHGPGGMAPVKDVHAKANPRSGAPRVNNKEGKFIVETEWLGRSGSFYAVGEAPVLRVVIKDRATGNPVDHTTITQANNWTVNAWLNGPRAKKMPVLSSAARADVTSLKGPFAFGNGGELAIEIDGGANDAAGVGSSGGVTVRVTLTGDMTAAQVADALNADAAFKAKAVAYTLDEDTGNADDAAYLKIRSKPNYGYSGIKVLTGGAASVLFDNGSDDDAFNDAGKQYDLFTGAITSANPTTRSASGSYSEFQLHLRSATNGVRDPKLTLTPDYIEYRFDSIDPEIPAGTYTLTLTVADASSAGTGTTPTTYFYETVQIGTDEAELLTASNCTSCHDYDKRWHENAPRGDGYPFSTNFCGSCHDYKQQRGGKNPANGLSYSWLAVAGSSAGQNWGFGAQPHSKRLHGLHFGNYLFKPREVHNGYQVSNVIWPQDTRNCQKCHATANARFSVFNQGNVMGVQRASRDNEAHPPGRSAANWLYLSQPTGEPGLTAGRGGTAAEVAAGTHDFEITSGRNLSNPGRIACNGCHDSDAAIAHTTLMTFDPTPANPFSGDESESCSTCHGVGRDFAISTKVMNISAPVQYPYNRAPSWQVVTKANP